MANINYKEIGYELSKTQDLDQLVDFKLKFLFSTDSAMASLATYASFRLSELTLKRAGQLTESEIQKTNARTVYERDIKPENRW